MQHRTALSTLLGLLTATVLAAGCGSAAPSPTASPSAAIAAVTPAPTPAPTVAPTASPTPAPSPTPNSTPTKAPASASPSAPADPYADKPYSLTLPTGWRVFDPSDPTAAAALTAFAKANPSFAGMLQLFQSSKIFMLAVNELTADAIVTAGIPSQGLSLTDLGQSLTAQFKMVPGVKPVAAPKPVKLPVGSALHWTITVTFAKIGGGTTAAVESIYLVADSKTAVIVEFVSAVGNVATKETPILNSLVLK